MVIHTEKSQRKELIVEPVIQCHSIPGASDASRYKALGNSVAIPCVEYVMAGIAAAMPGSFLHVLD